MSKSVVVLVSGGLDSATLLYRMHAEGYIPTALSFHYGQRHVRELQAAAHLCKTLGVLHEIIDISTLRNIFGTSSLTSMNPVPHGHYTDLSMKETIVPNRNMIFISVAAAFALGRGVQDVAYAAHAGDHTIYPDCRPEFGDAMERALSLCDWNRVTLQRPFIQMTKSEIVSLGSALGVPYALTWSCYEGGEVHCGACGTCVERKEAFLQARVADPTRYSE